jgi:hypothetical protein
MSDLTRILDALLEELTGRGSPIRQFLAPPLSLSVIKQLISRIDADVHPDVSEVFAWHNGIDQTALTASPTPYASIIPSHREFLPLEGALVEYERRRRLAARIAEMPMRDPAGGKLTKVTVDEVWSKSWFPVFFGGGSESIYVSNAKDGVGSVWIDTVQSDPERLFDSLAAAINAVTKALNSGVLQIVDGAYALETLPEAGAVGRI